MNKKLVTCPVCNTDQHVYAKKICIHNDGHLRCNGSKLSISDPKVKK